MNLKILPILSVVLASRWFSASETPIEKLDVGSHNNDVFVLEQVENDDFKYFEGEYAYKIVGVKDEYKENTELRIYCSDDYPVTEIDIDAFSDCENLSTLMISSTVKALPENFFATYSGIETVNYTYNKEFNDELFSEISGKSGGPKVNYYSCDEGFVNFWFLNVRGGFVRGSEKNNEPGKIPGLCDVTYQQYLEINKVFNDLSIEDKERVLKVPDADTDGATIEDSMNFLNNLYKNGPVYNNVNKEKAKPAMIGLVLAIASVGATFICIFYLMKERKIIK